MTAKYKGAINVAHNRNLPTINTNNQEGLYDLLQQHGFFWNSQLEAWEEHDIQDANEPTDLINIRVWADAEIVEEAADDIIRKIKNVFTLIERSKVYPCRPPKQREARVYLKFLPKGAK